MLKISRIIETPRTVLLKLEGRLAGPWVAELLGCCDAITGEGRTVELDLAGTTSADEVGLTVLAGLQSRGVMLKNGSMFLLEQLKLRRKYDPDA